MKRGSCFLDVVKNPLSRSQLIVESDLEKSSENHAQPAQAAQPEKIVLRPPWMKGFAWPTERSGTLPLNLSGKLMDACISELLSNPEFRWENRSDRSGRVISPGITEFIGVSRSPLLRKLWNWNTNKGIFAGIVDKDHSVARRRKESWEIYRAFIDLDAGDPLPVDFYLLRAALFPQETIAQRLAWKATEPIFSTWHTFRNVSVDAVESAVDAAASSGHRQRRHKGSPPGAPSPASRGRTGPVGQQCPHVHSSAPPCVPS